MKILVVFYFLLHCIVSQLLAKVGDPLAGEAVCVDELTNGYVYRLMVRNKDTTDHAVYHVFIPAGVDTVRGVFVHQHGCGMEGRGLSTAYDVQYQAFAKKWGLAIVGTDLYYGAGCRVWRDVESGSGPSLLNALHAVGATAGQPKLGVVPLLLWGHSGGGHWVLSMMKQYPERIMAAFCYSPAFDPSWVYPKEAQKIPVMIRHAGAEDINSPDVRCWSTALNSFHALRSAGGLASIAYTPYQNHNYSYVRYMTIPFYEAVLAQRMPREGNPSFQGMFDMDRRRAWLADTLLLNTYPSRSHQNDSLAMAWLPDSVVAAKWKEYVMTGTVIDRTPPPSPYALSRKRLHNVAVELCWKADADIESGIKYFNIYLGGKLIKRYPEHGVYQQFDTNGDDAIPMNDLPTMKVVVAVPAGAEGDLSISMVNHFDLESAKTTI